MAFSRGTMLEDGTVLVPVYGVDTDGNGRSMVWRSGPDGKRGWRLLSLGTHSKDLSINESSFVEVEPGRALALSRNATGYFTQRCGRTTAAENWSEPLLTDIWGPHSPPHLLRLQRRANPVYLRLQKNAPMGIRAVLSRRRGRDVGHVRTP